MGKCTSLSGRSLLFNRVSCCAPRTGTQEEESHFPTKLPPSTQPWEARHPGWSPPPTLTNPDLVHNRETEAALPTPGRGRSRTRGACSPDYPQAPALLTSPLVPSLAPSTTPSNGGSQGPSRCPLGVPVPQDILFTRSPGPSNPLSTTPHSTKWISILGYGD